MNYFLYKKSLANLNSKRDKEYKHLSKLATEAEKKGGREEAREVWASESFDLQIIEEEISILKSRYLTYQAQKRSLPVPSLDDKNGFWEHGNFENVYYLSNKGITEMRSLIRKDRKEVMEFVSYWITISFGLIGVITGLIAVIKK